MHAIAGGISGSGKRFDYILHHRKNAITRSLASSARSCGGTTKEPELHEMNQIPNGLEKMASLHPAENTGRTI